ncbi:4-(cytidine 5'-diphospho)-2-C-methyl-D-erythritol kinase [Desulfitobacterium sp. Sab5]|uniref:4-(cytidine 5'-diphospho)-2-C-methyl-D-erythritol kinase n=1 Tax=Desulfitobacterium TaxID=36853 RepID=UPI003CEC1624
MKEDCLVTFAYAKVNLGLAVREKRQDGYHELQSVMQTIGLYDTIKLSLTGCEIECICGGLSGPKNLAYQAAERFIGGLNLEKGIRIEIKKKIPIQAGLAGGSSDAAATLRGLNHLLNKPYSQEELLELANQLGSDVAFCLQGGTQWAEGRGERLFALPAAPEMDIILVKPWQGINTGESYRRFDQLGKEHPLNLETWQEALSALSIERIASLLSNDLEIGSQSILPEIADIKKDLREAGCYNALMSGSGSAVFGIARSETQARDIALSFKNKGYSVWVTKTITPNLSQELKQSFFGRGDYSWRES